VSVFYLNGAGVLRPPIGPAEFSTLSKRRSIRPQVSHAAATLKVVLIGFDNNVGSSSTVAIGSIDGQRGGPNRSLFWMHPARNDFVTCEGEHVIRDLMERLLYPGDAR
jgi:hypothetical protein